MKITILGSGNMAHFFAAKLLEHQHEINQVYSPSAGHGVLLAKHSNAKVIHNLKKLSPDADAYILALNDDALEDIARNISIGEKLLIHCAGSAPLNILKPSSLNRAVIWPVYSINKNNIPQRNDIPVLLEANNSGSLKMAKEIASALSSKVWVADYQQRRKLHLAAVMSNNFINHLLTLSKEIVSEQNLPFDILVPILEQTFDNAMRLSPEQNQTGPAIRHDEHTIQSHLLLLENHPEIQKIYQTMTSAIQQFYKTNPPAAK
jgi:predicted short-subunit dehydrogenase-like oxidoreductase (DUF2520 family)